MAETLTVAIVSSGGPQDLGASLARGFRQIGHHATLVPEPTVRPSQMLSPALALRERLPKVFVRDCKRLFRNIESRPPDLILVIKGWFIRPNVVCRLRDIAPTICWNPDSPFDSALTSGGGLVQEALPLYDGYVTWSASLARAISDLRDHVYVVPFGVDRDVHRPTSGSGIAKDRVVIIGTASPERIRLVQRLKHLKPLLFGNGWPRSFKARPPVYGRQFAAVAGESAWCINPLRPQNRDSHNMRTFELLACGANQLTMDTPDHRQFLAGTPTALADTFDELIERAADAAPSHGSPPDVTHYLYQRRCGTLLRYLGGDSLIDGTHGT
jgi:spore maturation protein CgeB